MILSIYLGNKITAYFTQIAILKKLKDRLYLPNKSVWDFYHKRTGWGKHKKAFTVMLFYFQASQFEGDSILYQSTDSALKHLWQDELCITAHVELSFLFAKWLTFLCSLSTTFLAQLYYQSSILSVNDL